MKIYPLNKVSIKMRDAPEALNDKPVIECNEIGILIEDGKTVKECVLIPWANISWASWKKE